jgi:hypothetical protein
MAYAARFLVIASFTAGFAPSGLAQADGIAPEWDVRKNLAQLSEDVRRLKPILDQVSPRDWIAKGAPEGYVTQHKSVLAEIDYLVGSAENLARNPEKMSIALETMFRLQSVEAMMTSMIEGVRKYQNPAIADVLRSMLTNNMNHREKLRSYIVELATIQEQEFEIANKEAQRCRAELLRKPAGSSRPTPAAKDEKRR